MQFPVFDLYLSSMHHLVSIFAKPTSGTVKEMEYHWPQWRCAIAMAQKCMASLYLGETYRGMGVFIKQDELLIPRHLIHEGPDFICGSDLKALVKRVQVFYNDQLCYAPIKGHSILEDGFEKDYCLIKLEGKFPCSIPEVSFNSTPSQCLFAEILEDGQVMISIVSPCSNHSQLMCSSVLNWTRPGSCGGVYLDISGQLIAIHLSQATGLCDAHTGEERKFLFAHEIMKCSPYFSTIDQEFCQIPLPTCLSPVLPDPCYIPQKDVRKATQEDAQGYYCEIREEHITNAQRGLHIDLIQKVQDRKKTTNKKICHVFYQVFLVDQNGNEKPNIHNNRGSPSSYNPETAPAFYLHMAQVYQDKIPTVGRQPAQFDFIFQKYHFRAKLQIE